MTNIKCIDNFPEVERKVKAIREFAKKMGYTVNEYYYKTDPMWRNQKSVDAFCIELCETSDSEGNPFEWAWSMEDGKEF